MGMRYQSLTGLEAGSMYMRKNALWKTCIRNSLRYDLCYQLRSFGMSGMTFDNNRAACCQRRRSVAPGRRIGKGKITAPKYDYRADRHLQLTGIGVFCSSCIYTHFQPGTRLARV